MGWSTRWGHVHVILNSSPPADCCPSLAGDPTAAVLVATAEVARAASDGRAFFESFLLGPAVAAAVVDAAAPVAVAAAAAAAALALSAASMDMVLAFFILGVRM